MNKILNKKILFLISFLVLNLQFSFAQNQTNNQIQNSNLSNCSFVFTKNLKMGDTDQGVLVLQQILNSDKRTIIANTGVGSKGQETNYFGAGTKQALKRFQALFYEYIGIADGNFNDRTRQVAQNIVCNQNSNSGNLNPQTNTTTTNTGTNISVNSPGPNITLSSNAGTIVAGSTFKILINSDKEIKAPIPTSFIIDGATVKEIRKLSKTQYVAIVAPIDGSDKIDIQIEAGTITALDGTQNANASNQINVNVSNISTASSTSQNVGTTVNSIFGTLSNILQQMTGQQPATQYCYGVQILATQNCSQTAQAQAAQQQQSAQSTSPTTGQTQPQISSPFQTAQTPYLNPATGQYQNTPPSQSQALLGSLGTSLGSTLGGNKSGGLESNDGKGVDSGVQSSKNNVQCGGADLSDSNARRDLKGALVGIGDVSTLEQLPVKVVTLLGKLKAACGCAVTVTGGTAGPPTHKTHGPHKPVVDVRSINDGAAFSSYIRSKFPSTAKSYACMDGAYNVYGAVFNVEGTGCGNPDPHWHVEAYGYKCD